MLTGSASFPWRASAWDFGISQAARFVAASMRQVVGGEERHLVVMGGILHV